VRERNIRWSCTAAVLIVGAFIALSVQPCVAKDAGVRVRQRMLPADRQYCGLDSLYACMRVAGFQNVALPQLEDGVRIGPDGISVSDLIAIADAKGITLEPVKTSLSSLQAWGKPAVLHVNTSHFIAYLYSDAGRLVIYDNAIGLLDCDPAWFNKKYKWKGVALVVGGVPPLPVRIAESPATIGILFAGCLAFGLMGAWPFKRRRQPAEVSNST
jgi:hypothetical protein